ncbi:hypothetical protein AVEN_91392-1, partial [Araneus ventricosus]
MDSDRLWHLIGINHTWNPDLGDKSKIPGNAITILISLLVPRSGFIQMIPCNFTAFRETINRPCSDQRAVRVDRLGSPLECERLWNLSLEFYPLCEK